MRLSLMSTRLTLAAVALFPLAAALLGAPPAPRGHALRMSSTDTLYGASDARRTEEPAVAADGAEDAADGAEAAADGAEAALPDDAAGVDMFGNPVSESGELLGDAAAADFEAFEAFPDDAPLPPGFEEPAETLAAAAAFQEDVAGPAEVTYREADFVGSEWKIGVLWRDKEKIDVTWVRCKEDGNSEWGWGANGKWRLEDGSFLTFTRDFPLGWNGKRLFSARVGADGNFVEGVVRGWKPFESATIMGQWQAIRLGVEGRGAAPWFEDEEGE